MFSLLTVVRLHKKPHNFTENCQARDFIENYYVFKTKFRRP